MAKTNETADLGQISRNLVGAANLSGFLGRAAQARAVAQNRKVQKLLNIKPPKPKPDNFVFRRERNWDTAKNSDALIRFQEQRYHYLYHDVRVFVQGVEISNWLTGGVTINLTEASGYNTVQFSLDNAYERFVLTEENLGYAKDSEGKQLPPMFRTSAADIKASEEAKQRLYLYKSGDTNPQGTNYVARAQAQMTALAKRATVRNLLLRRGQRAKREDDLLHKQVAEQALLQIPDSKWDDPEFEDVAAPSLARTLAGLSITGVDGRPKTIPVDRAREIIDDYIAEAMTRAQKDLSPEQRSVLRRAQLDRAYGSRDRIRTTRSLSETYDIGAKDADGKPILKSGEPPKPAGSQDGKTQSRNATDPDTGDTMWPLSVRSCILDKNDPIRVFLRNPYTEDRDQWYFGFTGYLDNVTVNRDYKTGHSTISVTAYDIRALMAKMRVSFTPILGIPVVQALFGKMKSIFADLYNPIHYTSAYAAKPIEQAVPLLVVGEEQSSKKTEEEGRDLLNGIGNFRLGRIVRYPGESRSSKPDTDAARKILQDWHTRAFVDDPNDPRGKGGLKDRRATWLTYDEVSRVGRETTTTGKWAPDRRYLHMLIPPDGTGLKDLMNYSFQAGSPRREWQSRLQILTDLMSTVHYQWWVTPVGDIVVEPTMCDFYPEDFGDYAPLFAIDLNLIDGHFAEASGSVLTGLEMSGGYAFTDVAPRVPEGAMPRVVVQSDIMMAKYGVQIETDSRPFIEDENILECLALLEFQKRVADASKMEMAFAYRPLLCPNRPIRNDYDCRLGLSFNTQTIINIHRDVTSTVYLKYIRSKRNDGTYRHVTGGEVMAVSLRSPRGDGVCGDLSGTGMRTSRQSKSNSATNLPLAHPNLLVKQRHLIAAYNRLSPEAKKRLYNIVDCFMPAGDGPVLTPAVVKSPGLHGSVFDDRSNSDNYVNGVPKLLLTSAVRKSTSRGYHRPDVGLAVDIRSHEAGSKTITPRDGAKYIVGRAIYTAEQRARLVACAAQNGYEILDERHAEDPHFHLQPTRKLAAQLNFNNKAVWTPGANPRIQRTTVAQNGTRTTSGG